MPERPVTESLRGGSKVLADAEACDHRKAAIVAEQANNGIPCDEHIRTSTQHMPKLDLRVRPVEVIEQILYGRYMAWVVVLAFVVYPNGWSQHVLTMAAMGYEDGPKLYRWLEDAILRPICGLPRHTAR